MGSENVIPFGKAVRIHNYKLWRGNYTIEEGKKKTPVECLYVSTIDGAWMTRIPSTIEMYGFLVQAYEDWKSDDPHLRANGEAVLTVVISNMLYVSSIGNGYYQRALELCATVYAHPSLVNKKSKEYKGFMKDVKGLTEKFLEWRSDFDSYVKKQNPEEESQKRLEQDEIAEQAMEVLSKDES